MIPKPPFASSLTRHDELARFEQLKSRLPQVWERLTAREEETYPSGRRSGRQRHGILELKARTIGSEGA